MEEQKNKYGLSKKTNVAMAAITGIAAAQSSQPAIIAITVIALIAVSLQFIIDYKKAKK